MENNKGFTLIELIATIIILAVVMSIGAYAITNVIRQSREKNYAILIKNIKDGVEVYYQECTYSNNSGIECRDDWTIKLGDLVTYGYVKSNAEDKSGKLINPLDDSDISDCTIKVIYNDGEIDITPVGKLNNISCPTSYDLDNLDYDGDSGKLSNDSFLDGSRSSFSNNSSLEASQSTNVGIDDPSHDNS